MSFLRFIFAAVVGSALFLGNPGTCAAQQKTVTGSPPKGSYKYDTPETRLEGTLVERKVYGPPGYGETPRKDAKETILVLKLSHAIAVEPAGNAEASGSPNLDAAKGVIEVQLFLNSSVAVDTKKLVGTMITATGTLNESVTASQRTKVWMHVQRLESK